MILYENIFNYINILSVNQFGNVIIIAFINILHKNK